VNQSLRKKAYQITDTTSLFSRTNHSTIELINQILKAINWNMFITYRLCRNIIRIKIRVKKIKNTKIILVHSSSRATFSLFVNKQRNFTKKHNNSINTKNSILHLVRIQHYCA